MLSQTSIPESSLKYLPTEEKLSTSASYCSWHQTTSTWIYASGEHVKPAHRASSNLRKLFHLAAGRTTPLFPVLQSYLSFTTGIPALQVHAREHVAGHSALAAFPGTKEPGKWQLFSAHDFILELGLTASFVQNTQGFYISDCRFSGTCHVRETLCI